ncbi:amino acid adenylation domain-containing protein [Streptomyces atratus]|uniref:Amino acid adenylation domain-containing protein n=1 Tax=Streptomyces atratus TaxID=1893 RepID=A0A1K1ZTZ9_STRAR|nr:amino acid adenylation domain-containing protein [Streptomyces atratus]
MSLDQPKHASSSGAQLLRDRLRQRAPEQAAHGLDIPVAPRNGSLPLSFAQRRLWVLDQLRPGGTEYLVPLVFRLTGPAAEADIRGALNELVRRQEILRTRYTVDEDGEPAQTIDPPSAVDLLTDDFTGASPSELDDLLYAESSRPFDLATGPVLRARLIRLAPEEHVLAITVHHIAVDGWSGSLLARELAALCAGESLPEPRLQYADFAAWQRAHASDERLDRELEYWVGQLRDLPALELPTDRTRPALWEPSGATVTFEIPAALARRAGALAGAQRATPFMVYLAVFWSLLHRYTGQSDFAVGSPIAGRTHADTQDLIGLFLNTLVLRADLSGDPSFTELLRRARVTAVDAYAHQDVPFERVVDALVVDRDLATHPLVGVNFVLQNNEPFRFEAGALTGELIPLEQRHAQFDLTWALEEHADGSVTCSVTFPHSLTDARTVRRMGEHYVRLLDAAVGQPGTRISELPLVSQDEARRPTGPAPATCLHERFAEQAAQRPHAVALTCDGEHLTYGELDARANRLAHVLRAAGAGREDLVGICLRRGIDLIVTVLATLKAGAAYLPLDPAHPAERIDHLIRDASARVIVTESTLAERVSAAPVPGGIIVLDDPAQRALLAASPVHAPASDAHVDDLAYVIHTSGSTGRPKGVQVTHANVVRLLDADEDVYGFGTDDVWTLFHSYAFDFSVWEMWGALFHGGRLVVVPQEVARSPWDLVRLLADEGVTVLNQTPSAFRNLVELTARNEPLLDGLRLRLVIFGGEMLDVGMLRPWWDRFGDHTPLLVNMYGITETTVHVTSRPLSRDDLDGYRSPIGTPLPDLTLHILDGRMRPVPAGATGEIYVGGPGVTRGYLGRPARTSERFVPDPFGPPGARLYRSGDQARVLPGGDIGFLGRSDEQVKIRGFRIEPGEIESCLTGHQDLTAAAVTVHEAAPGDRELVAYVVPKDGSAAATADLRRYLAARLPGYMVPAVFISVPKLALTANGKLDHSALPSPERSRQERSEAYVAPRTADEETMAAALAEVLGGQRIGVHDNFFALGGDSIRAVRLVGLLRASGLPYSVQDLFRHQTIAELAASRGASPAEEGGVPPFSLIGEADRAKVPDGVSDAYPLAGVQAGMVYEMLADSERNLYHNITSYLIRDDGPFDAPALAAAVDTVVDRHEVLRTAFDLRTFSEPLQLVYAAARAEFGHADLRDRPAEDQKSFMDGFRQRERERLFAHGEAPLIRVNAHRVADDRFYLSLTEHHAVLDGWSHNSVLTEIIACYRAIRAEGTPPDAPRPAVRFADFIAQERRSLDGPEDREFWAGRLESAVRLTIPPAWADPDGPGDYHLRVPYRHMEERLRHLARLARASLKSVLLAAHVAVWRTFAEGDAFYSGLVCNGRTEVQGGDQVRGMFLNPVPLVAPGGAKTWRDLVSEVFAREVELWPHRRFPMPRMQQEFGHGDRLFDVAFNYLDFHVLDREAVDTSDTTDISLNEFPLCVLTEAGDLVLVAKSSRIGERHTALLADMYRSVLDLMAADPDGSAEVSLLPHEERLRLLAEGNDPGQAAGPGRAVHELVFEHARRTPRAVAVEFGADRLTYEELWQRAGSWSAALRASGVRAGDLVGVCLPASLPDLVAAVIGVVGLGAAYVPVDPSHPAERNTAILTEAGVRTVIAETEAQAGPLQAVLPAQVRDLPAAMAPRPTHAEELVYVVHTSGSSGRPKGVMVRHSALSDRVLSMIQDMGLGPDHAVATVVPTTTDVWQLDVFVALAAGGRLILAGNDYAKDPVSLTDVLRAHGATLMQASPTTWRMLDETGWTPPPGFHRVSGGESLGATLAQRLGSTEAGVWDMYGPAEATVYCFGSRYAPNTAPRWVLPRDTACRLLDDKLEPVPFGVAGQIHVGGGGLAQGYLGRPSGTADVFLPDPYTTVPGSRMYATGDIGRRLADGRIEVLGRRDHQLKIRGFRIELGEVEAVLTTHPEVRSAVVRPVPGPAETQQLAAYVILRQEALPLGELVRYARKTLPGYMVPTHFVAMEAFPRLANGKVDRNALPAPESGMPPGDTEYEPPVGPVEKAIAATWAEALGVERVGREDDFYALGGHSLLTMRIIARLSRGHSVELTFRDFLQHRTVRAMARQASSRRDTGGESSPLIWLGETGAAEPLFCVHPGGGSAHWYRELAETYAGTRPVAAFEWPGLHGHALHPESLAEVAATYVAELKRAWPHGPYNILGWCGSSGIAWEMARKLRADGEHPRLMLIDPIEYPSTGVNPLAANVAQLRRADALLTRLRELPDGPERARVRSRLLEVLSAIVDDGATVFAEEGHDLDLVHGWTHRIKSWRQMAELRLTYRFPQYAGSVDVLVCQELAEGGYEDIIGRTFDRYLDQWRRLATGGVRSGRIPGDHRSALFPPHVSTLAARLDEVIARFPNSEE